MLSWYEAFVSACLCVYVCMCVCMYVCMYVCIWVMWNMRTADEMCIIFCCVYMEFFMLCYVINIWPSCSCSSSMYFHVARTKVLYLQYMGRCSSSMYAHRYMHTCMNMCMFSACNTSKRCVTRAEAKTNIHIHTHIQTQIHTPVREVFTQNHKISSMLCQYETTLYSHIRKDVYIRTRKHTKNAHAHAYSIVLNIHIPSHTRFLSSPRISLTQTAQFNKKALKPLQAWTSSRNIAQAKSCISFELESVLVWVSASCQTHECGVRFRSHTIFSQYVWNMNLGKKETNMRTCMKQFHAQKCNKVMRMCKHWPLAVLQGFQSQSDRKISF